VIDLQRGGGKRERERLGWCAGSASGSREADMLYYSLTKDNKKTLLSSLSRRYLAGVYHIAIFFGT